MVKDQMPCLRHEKPIRWDRTLVFQKLGHIVPLFVIMSIFDTGADELFAGVVRPEVAQSNLGR